MRNKVTNFPNQNNNKLEGEPRAKAEYASTRADGTINTHPQERMYASSHREDDTSAVLKDH
jgi:small acid-soluble spore protein K (minor)